MRRGGALPTQTVPPGVRLVTGVGGTRTSGSARQWPDSTLGMGEEVPSLRGHKQSWALMWGDTGIPQDLARAAASPQRFTGNCCKLQAL